MNGITNGQAFPTPAGSWGSDMSGNLVTNYITWASAVNQLRQCAPCRGPPVSSRPLPCGVLRRSLLFKVPALGGCF